MNVYPMLDVFLAFMAIVGVFSLLVAINDLGTALINRIRGKSNE